MKKTQALEPKTTPVWIDMLLLTLILGCLFFTLLGTRPLFVPDEGRYAEIAREMITNHDWVTPTLNHITYFEKPVLFYWLGAIAIKLGGLNLWSLRSVNAILSIFGCLLTYAFTRHYLNRATGLLAALVLGTSSLYFVMTHMVSLDLPVTVFISATLMATLLAYDAKTKKTTRLFLWLAALASALAVLTKGLIGLVFPGLIFASYLLLINGWKRLWPLPLFSSLLLFLLIAAPWHILVNHRHPEFFYFYFIEQHFLRYTTKDIGHYQPTWFFIPVLLAGLYPWVTFLPQTLALAISRLFKRDTESRFVSFLFLWIVIVFTFFSFSKSKLIPYILPLFPPLAILIAMTLQRARLKAAIFGLALLTSALIFTTKSLLANVLMPNPIAAETTLSTALTLLLVLTGLSLFLLKKHKTYALGSLVIGSGLFMVILFSAFPDMDTRTVRPLTDLLRPILQPGDEVITYNQYYQDLPFYLQRRVSILNWRNEMTYGMAHQDTRAWMINDAEFWKRWNSPQRVFVFINRDELAKLRSKNPRLKATDLGMTTNTALITNKPN